MDFLFQPYDVFKSVFPLLENEIAVLFFFNLSPLRSFSLNAAVYKPIQKTDRVSNVNVLMEINQIFCPFCA